MIQVCFETRLTHIISKKLSVWRFFQAADANQTFVEQVVPLGSIVLAFVRLDNLCYAEILDSETGKLKWSHVIHFAYQSSKQTFLYGPRISVTHV